MTRPSNVLQTMKSACDILLPALLFAPIALGGCITEGAPKPSPKAKPAITSTAPPAAMSITPLTRVGFDQRGLTSVFLYLDFRDAAGASVKAFGVLHVELYLPAGAIAPIVPPATGAEPAAGAKPQVLALRWDSDLRDRVANALTFDELITRTYTITLNAATQRSEATKQSMDAADWLLHWSRKEAPAADSDPPTLMVQFTPSEGGKVLRATHTLTR